MNCCASIAGVLIFKKRFKSPCGRLKPEGENKKYLKDYRGALADYTKAISLYPNFSDYYLDRGKVKSLMGDYQGAIADCTKAITSTRIKVDFMMAEIYYERGINKLMIRQKDSGCLDLSKAGELGKKEAYEMIKKYCQ